MITVTRNQFNAATRLLHENEDQLTADEIAALQRLIGIYTGDLSFLRRDIDRLVTLTRKHPGEATWFEQLSPADT